MSNPTFLYRGTPANRHTLRRILMQHWYTCEEAGAALEAALNPHAEDVRDELLDLGIEVVFVKEN